MSGKGDMRRPSCKGLYDKEARLVKLNIEIFYEKNEVNKDKLKKLRDELKEELYGK
jgi:hypothetical protein